MINRSMINNIFTTKNIIYSKHCLVSNEQATLEDMLEHIACKHCLVSNEQATLEDMLKHIASKHC